MTARAVVWQVDDETQPVWFSMSKEFSERFVRPDGTYRIPVTQVVVCGDIVSLETTASFETTTGAPEPQRPWQE